MQAIELIHPELANVSKKEITDKLAKTLKVKEECISIFGMKTKFGGGRSSGFALVYDSADARKQYDSKTNLLRVSMTCSRVILFETTDRIRRFVCGQLCLVRY